MVELFLFSNGLCDRKLAVLVYFPYKFGKGHLLSPTVSEANRGGRTDYYVRSFLVNLAISLRNYFQNKANGLVTILVVKELSFIV